MKNIECFRIQPLAGRGGSPSRKRLEPDCRLSKGGGYETSSSFPQKELLEVIAAYLLTKRRSALPTPQEGGMTMATFLPSSAESCEGGDGLCLLKQGGLPF